MWQIYREKETCGIKGGLVSGWKQSMKSVSNNEWREVPNAESIRDGTLESKGTYLEWNRLLEDGSGVKFSNHK